jgi:hypothetical protein
VPNEVQSKVVKLALRETELSPRELAVTFTDRESYFVSEASTYRILKAHDLITSPTFQDNVQSLETPPLGTLLRNALSGNDRRHVWQAQRLAASIHSI